MLKSALPMEMVHAFSLVTNKSMVRIVKLKWISESKLRMHGMILLHKTTFHDILFVTTKVSELVIDSFSFSITLVTVMLCFDFLISIF